MQFKLMSSVLFCTALGGCAATGTSYQDILQNKVVDSAQASLILFRTTESAVGSARTTSVKLDGRSVEGVKYGGFTHLNTSPGLHTLIVDLPDTFGKCILPISVVSGKEYYFEIKPRIDSLGLGGAVGAYLESGNKASPKREDCKGSFFIEPVEDGIALEKLKELKSGK